MSLLGSINGARAFWSVVAASIFSLADAVFTKIIVSDDVSFEANPFLYDLVHNADERYFFAFKFLFILSAMSFLFVYRDHLYMNKYPIRRVMYFVSISYVVLVFYQLSMMMLVSHQYSLIVGL